MVGDVYAQKFLLNSFWLTSIGKLNAQQIIKNDRLSDEQREDLLALAELYADAMRQREDDSQYGVDPITL